MSEPVFYPPVLLQPDRSADALLVRRVIERLRPEVVCVVGLPLGSVLSGLPVGGHEELLWRDPCPRCAGTGCDGMCCAGGPGHLGECVCAPCGSRGSLPAKPRFVIAEPDPALRSIWEAARTGTLVEAADHGLTFWSQKYLRARLSDGRKDEGPRTCFDAWKRLKQTGPTGQLAMWAIAAAAGCRDGRWGRQRKTHAPDEEVYAPLISLYHESGDPGEVERRLFPSPHEPFDCGCDAFAGMLGGRCSCDCHTPRPNRAEQTQAWVQAHVEHVTPSPRHAFKELQTNADRRLLLVEGADESIRRMTWSYVEDDGNVIAWATDETIDEWAPLQPETEVRVARLCEGEWWRVNERHDVDEVPFVQVERGELFIGAPALHRRDVQTCTLIGRRRDGVTWSRRDDGSWLGLSSAVQGYAEQVNEPGRT